MRTDRQSVSTRSRGVASIPADGQRCVDRRGADTWHRSRSKAVQDLAGVAAVLFLLSGIPKMLKMEEIFEVDVGHADVVSLVERYLEKLEPRG